jgi:hypothetical protein
MRTPKSKIAYPRKQIIQVLRTLNELVVSLDRIGSASYEMTKEQNDAALHDFVRRHNIFRKTADARRILSAPFSTAVGADGMDELEREMQRIRYWKVGKGGGCRRIESAGQRGRQIS